MADGIIHDLVPPSPGLTLPRALRIGLSLGMAVLLASLLAPLLLPKGYALAAFGDTLQVGLLVALTILTFQNLLRSHFQVRIFWFLILAGSLLWTASDVIWSLNELWFAHLVPDVPAGDILLFVKVVPLTAAVVLVPDHKQDSRFRAFGLLDVLILMLYALYLYVFVVFAYRLVPGGIDTYNFQFNLADSIGNLIFMIVAGIAALRSQGQWRSLLRLYFFAASCYGLSSVLNNVAIDLGRYYTGSLYDVPLNAAMVAFICVALRGRTVEQERPYAPPATEGVDSTRPAPFVSSLLAMLVALSTPVIGMWLLSSNSAPLQLRPFRLTITLLTILLLTLFLSIKQDLLTAGLFDSLKRLSETYSSIERFKTHLTQSEKLASLGELVAQAANQIKACMASILESSSRLTSRPDTESRIQSMAGKIAQYAHRTDVLVDNMLHFAQETPLLLVPLDVRPLLESALHLSRIANLSNVHVDLVQESNCPLVRGDSSQLLHVFVQLISNTTDALGEVGGGTLEIAIRSSGSQLLLEFADSGPGIREPQRVFEPFYTTKPVGKGTGLGLSTCYGIIHQHQGEISCHNRPEGGAVFSILLPITSEPLPERAKEMNRVPAEGVS